MTGKYGDEDEVTGARALDIECCPGSTGMHMRSAVEVGFGKAAWL